MTYIRRAVKYFIQLVILFVLIIAVLVMLGYVSPDVNLAFKSGWSSVGLIALLFAVMSAVYPAFGYGRRKIISKGDPASFAPSIDEAMKERGYKLLEGSETSRVYILRSGVNRAARLWEDRITITPQLYGFEAEGLVRDLARVVMSIEHNINSHE